MTCVRAREIRGEEWTDQKVGLDDVCDSARDTRRPSCLEWSSDADGVEEAGGRIMRSVI
jgi:hypothetical protein